MSAFGPPYRRKWTPIAPDLTLARGFRARIFEAWIAEGHAGSCGAAEEVDEALAELSAEDGEAAAERARRFLRARKAEHKQAPDVINYIRKRSFDQHPPPPEMPGDFLEVKRKSREMDALFWRYARSADPISAAKARALMRDSRFGKRILVRREDLPTQEEIASVGAKVERDGEDFKAWGRHLARRPSDCIIWLDPKAFGRWPYFPSRRPALDDAARLAEAKLEERRRTHRPGEGAAA